MPLAFLTCFAAGGKNLISYTQVLYMCICIKRGIGFGVNITPIRFRTTVPTGLYDRAKDSKLEQAAAGRTRSATIYVKGREEEARATAAMDDLYGKQKRQKY